MKQERGNPTALAVGGVNKVLVSDLLSQQGLDVLTESGDFEVDVILDLSH